MLRVHVMCARHVMSPSLKTGHPKHSPCTTEVQVANLLMEIVHTYIDLMGIARYLNAREQIS